MWILSNLRTCGRCICRCALSCWANGLILPEACQDSEMSKNEVVEELDMDQLARTGNTACFRILTEVTSCYGVNLAWLNRTLYLESFFMPSYVSCYSGSIKFGQSSLVKLSLVKYFRFLS